MDSIKGEGSSVNAQSSKPLPSFIRDLLASPPQRAENGGLHSWLFRIARLLHPYRGEVEIIDILRAVTSDQYVKPNEIEDAVRNSKGREWRPGAASAVPRQPAWPQINQEQREAIIALEGGFVDLWESSPVRFDDQEPHSEEIIDALFPGNPMLCVGKSSSQFKTCHREEFRGQLSRLQHIVPSPMRAITGKTKDGRISEHTLDNTGQRKFLVVEQDAINKVPIPLDEQAAMLLHLSKRAPLVLAVHSGGKSIHGWFYCTDRDEALLRRFFSYAVSLGADPQVFTKSLFVRMPDGLRDSGVRQTVYFFDPERLARLHNLKKPKL